MMMKFNYITMNARTFRDRHSTMINWTETFRLYRFECTLLGGCRSMEELRAMLLLFCRPYSVTLMSIVLNVPSRPCHSWAHFVCIFSNFVGIVKSFAFTSTWQIGFGMSFSDGRCVCVCLEQFCMFEIFERTWLIHDKRCARVWPESLDAHGKCHYCVLWFPIQWLLSKTTIKISLCCVWWMNADACEWWHANVHTEAWRIFQFYPRQCVLVGCAEWAQVILMR